MKQKKCVFAGTFDPPTLGHKKAVETCLALFDEVVVAVMINPEKTPMFSATEREEMLKLDFPDKRVCVRSFCGTAAELLEREATPFYVRGVRNATDFDYETLNYYATKKMFENIQPVYLPCPQELLHVSSSAVRTLLKFGKPVDGYVSEAVKAYMKTLEEKKNGFV